MDRRCRDCGNLSTLWAHSGGTDSHSWSNGDESVCPCVPTLMCGVCHHEFLDAHAVVLLSEDEAPKQESVALH